MPSNQLRRSPYFDALSYGSLNRLSNSLYNSFNFERINRGREEIPINIIPKQPNNLNSNWNISIPVRKEASLKSPESSHQRHQEEYQQPIPFQKASLNIEEKSNSISKSSESAEKDENSNELKDDEKSEESNEDSNHIALHNNLLTIFKPKPMKSSLQTLLADRVIRPPHVNS